MLGIRWQEKISNDAIRQSGQESGNYDIIDRRKLLLFGQSCRMGSTDKDSAARITGSVDGMGQTGRPPKKWTENITDWTELSSCSAVTRSCSVEQDCIWLQWLLTTGQEKADAFDLDFCNYGKNIGHCCSYQRTKFDGRRSTLY